MAILRRTARQCDYSDLPPLEEPKKNEAECDEKSDAIPPLEEN